MSGIVWCQAGVHDRAVRYVREHFLGGFDTHDIGGIMEWAEILHFAEGVENFRGYDDGFDEFGRPPWRTAVSDGLDHAHVLDDPDFGIGQSSYDKLYRDGMVRAFMGAFYTRLCLWRCE